MKLPNFPLLLLSAASIATATPARAGEDPPSPPKVLVYTTSAGFEHEVVHRPSPAELSLVERAMIELGRGRGGFEAVCSRDPAEFDAEALARYELVFFYTTGELPLSAARRENLFAFVRSGKGFAGAHCATDTFYEVPEYGAMIGGWFDGHPWHEEVRIRVEDREHPAMRHLGEGFSITDEIYQFKEPYDRARNHVLASLEPRGLDLAKPGVRRKDGDFAVAWTREHGKGRVFYTSLGHRPEVWKDERFLAHLAGGMRWAMRREPVIGSPKSAPPGEARKKDTTDGTGKAPAGSGSKTSEPPASAALPAVPPGFAIDLVASAPEILWPSAVLCLPDGSLLVGEDRMDMPGPADQPLDRILRLRWKADGTFEKTVFAEKLFAVFGLEEVDGAVYCVNMPHLTVLRDEDGDGVAEEREELLSDLGPKAPGWPKGFNDHIVSGTRLGLDGRLYVAVGDKGIPLVHGTDGSTLSLCGGGVVRVRPDGGGLELVAKGLRNILDVAIDERGEMFTHDNTDDGLGWWTRFSHVVEGGEYGYPWAYRDHPERVLPAMAEYGGGSPCGGLVYREYAWPAPYPGSVFFCEWGKGVLRRFELERAGASFRVAKAEDFATANGVPDFRPLDVCESPDGRFLYLSDWGYSGWTDPREAGRLWRIRRADDDPRSPSLERALPADLAGRIAALGDPSFRVRLRAQRALEKADDPATRAALIGTLERSSSPRARRHALWALPGDARDEVIRVAEHAQEPELRAQAARWMRARDAVEADLCLAWLADPDATLRREAAQTLARDRSPDLSGDGARAAAPGLVAAIETAPDAFVRFAAQRALRRLPAAPGLADLTPELQQSLLDCWRESDDPRAVDLLAELVAATLPAATRAIALDVLASCCRREPPWDGVWWNIQPAKNPPPPRTVDWQETPRILSVLRGALSDPEAPVRAAAIAALEQNVDRGSAPALVELAISDVDPALRRSALDALASWREESAGSAIEHVLRDPGASVESCRHAAAAAVRIRNDGMRSLLAELARDTGLAPERRAVCARALGEIAEPGSERTIESLLCDGEPEVRRAAVQAIGKLASERGAEVLLPLYSDPALRDDVIEALARRPDARALVAYLAGLDGSDAARKLACSRALAAIREEVRGALEAEHARGGLSPAQLEAVRALYREPAPITEWVICGPLPLETEVLDARTIAKLKHASQQPAKEQELAPEDAADARSADRSSAGHGPAAARRVEAKLAAHEAKLAALDAKRAKIRRWRTSESRGFVDLERVIAPLSDRAAFALARIDSRRARRASLHVGSDDQVTVWLDGRKVHEFTGTRAWKAGEDRVELDLPAGRSTLLVRIGQRSGQWSFNAELDGDPEGGLFEDSAPAPSPSDDLRAYAELASRSIGDPARGHRLFRDVSRTMCLRCHALHGDGARIGPDLSDVGAKYARAELVSSVLEPSKRVLEGYRTTTFELADGRVLSGQVQREDATLLELADIEGEITKVEAAEIASRTPQTTSLMPEGLARLLSPEEFADLIAFLETLRGAPGK